MTESTPGWYKRAVFYEMPVYAFGDSDGDGIGDFPGLDRSARLPPMAGHRLPLAAAVLRVPAARRRLRHLRLRSGAAQLRKRRERRGLPRRRPRARSAGHRRHDRESHLRPAPVVPGGPPAGFSDPVTLCVERRLRTASPTPRVIFTDTQDSNWTWDPVAGRLLLASLLRTSTGSQLRQSRGAQRDRRRRALLARCRASTACASTPCPYLYERDGTNGENLPETHAYLKELRAMVDRGVSPARSCSPRPTSGPKTSSRTSAMTTSATWRSTSR